MGIEAFVVAQVVSAFASASAAADEAEANIDQAESAEKSRALAQTKEFNNMMAANVVAQATSGTSLASASFIQGVKASDMNFRLNRASDTITTGNQVIGYKQKAKNAKTMAVIQAGTSIIGGYNATSKLAPAGTGFKYFGMNFKGN